MKLGGLGGLNEVCGIIYETIRYDDCTLANPVFNASVVLVQPVVVVVVILFRLEYVVIVCIVVCSWFVRVLGYTCVVYC
jgi:hypothetical protein